MALSTFVRVLLFVAAFAPSAHAQRAKAYVITDNTTGFILEAVEAEKKLQVGSLTKVATAMVVLDWAAAKGVDLAQLATVPSTAAALANAQGVGFEPGDRCSLRDLLYAALMQSDNVAAETLADHVGRALGGGTGQLSAADFFVAQMNALARRIGMVRTRFVNPHGLDHLERTLPYSTAADLAKLTSYAMQNAGFRFYVSQRERKIAVEGVGGEPNGYLLRNTNELLSIGGIDGVKTGTTNRAGQCIIVSSGQPPDSRQDGEKFVITPRRLNVVVLASRDRFADADTLLKRGWRLYEAWAAAGRPVKGWRAPR